MELLTRNIKILQRFYIYPLQLILGGLDIVVSMKRFLLMLDFY